jgi:multicomponent Na+:H+ antiporter subunit C
MRHLSQSDPAVSLMETLLAITIGVIFSASVYLFLSRDLPRILLGFILLGAGTNLAILLVGRIGSLRPALIDTADGVLGAGAANPLPQALILTAIVIGFGLAAFALMLALQTWRRFGTLEAEDLTEAEGIDPATLSSNECDPGAKA